MEQNEAPKVPAVQELSTRDGTLTKDSAMFNCYAEPSPDGAAAVKRPGTVLVLTPPVGGVPQGQFLCQGVAYCIQNDVIYNTATGTSVAIPTVTDASTQYSVLSDAPLGTSLIKSATGLWVVRVSTPNGAMTLTKVVNTNVQAYPALTVSGVAYLDGTYYVMDSTGAVYGSVLEDPLSWPALNYISADATLGVGAGIVRHLNYIIAFYSHGTQFYYDAGLTPNSPLAAVGNAAWTTGCAIGASIKEATDLTFFISKTRQFGKTVSKYEGLSLTKISTPFIEKIINTSTLVGTTSFNIKTAGHTFYAITLPDINATLVYDVTFENWHVWTSVVNGVEQCFTGVNYLGSSTQDLFQDSSTGQIVSMVPTSYVDTTGPINFKIRTKTYSWGTERQKRFAAMFARSDAIATNVLVRYTDDDYNTFSTYRAINMASDRKMLQRCGMARLRAWDFLHTDSTPMRIFYFELNLTVGTS